MSPTAEAQPQSPQTLDGGLAALSLIAGYFRIAADPAQLRHQLALTGRLAGAEDLVRAANLLELKSRVVRGVRAKRLGAIPFPAILELKAGGFAVAAVASEKGKIRLVDPVARTAKEMSLEEAEGLSSGAAILVSEASQAWRNDIAHSVTIQIRAAPGEDAEALANKVAGVARAAPGVQDAHALSTV